MSAAKQRATVIQGAAMGLHALAMFQDLRLWVSNTPPSGNAILPWNGTTGILPRSLAANSVVELDLLNERSLPGFLQRHGVCGNGLVQPALLAVDLHCNLSHRLTAIVVDFDAVLP